ncbi:MAG: AsmA-like C-terminal region-containing protein [Cephaloticoccus sp.]|nr:AsmA-like C-terminal region-containing protein [Cephaloticoccus sp.]MCF7759055.1 AsmA-like C-terminal region-containing protein [Cephaloticoccus sp.]
MKAWHDLLHRCTLFCVDCLLSFCRWTLWLALALLVVVQTYIAFVQEMPVPDFLLRSFETRLAASGFTAKFGRTTFDPSGRILVENLRLSLASFEEPVATARLLYVELDPWALISSRFQPRLIRASGVNLQVPAMLSDSGSGENLLRDVDFTLSPHEQTIELHHLTARLAGLSISARGSIDLSSLPRVQANALPLPAMLASNYPRLCELLIQASRQLSGVKSPQIDLVFSPSARIGAITHVTLRGSGIEPVGQRTFSTGPFELNTMVSLWNRSSNLARITASVDSVDLPNQMRARGLRVNLEAFLTGGQFALSPQQADLTLDRLVAAGVVVQALSADFHLGKLPDLEADLLAMIGSQPVAINGSANLTERSAALHISGKFDPALLVPLGQKIGHDIRPFLDFGAPPEIDLNLRVNPGGKFAGVEGRVRGTDVHAYHVTFDHIAGHIAYDGTRFIATDAAASIGTNYARGSYEQVFPTKEFRFLLTGQLRPPDIGGWFREWWPNFWRNFDFSAAAPDASVDVRGIWGRGHETSVFVFADCTQPVIKGVQLDHATTLIYLRPHYYDAMEVSVSRGQGIARGNFVRRNADDSPDLKRMDFNFDSSLDLAKAAGLVGPELEEIVAPFKFTSAPHLHVAGFIAEPAAEPHRHVEVRGESTGNFTFHDFPLSDLTFAATMQDDDLRIEPLVVSFAGGRTTGRMQILGPTGRQRLGFDLGLKQGNLQMASVILGNFFAAQQGKPPPATSAYIQQSANVTMDLDVSAEGDLENPLSYAGSGNAVLRGKGLGEIRLLGLLSELLNFTALHFNEMRTSFTVQKDRLIFPEVSITGSNSLVEASGKYSLALRALDFNARIYPFHESKFILKSFMGALLTPLSNVLEVKLTGELDNPNWSFVIGPTNFLRSLIQTGDPLQPPETKIEVPPLYPTAEGQLPTDPLDKLP